jgi:hypothetical protein
MDPNTQINRDIHPEIKVLDAKKGLVSYVASDETLDSYQEVILAKGWRFDERFKSNPVFVDSHSYGSISELLGKVVDWEVKNDQLVEKVQWAIDVETNHQAKLGFDMTEKGYLKAVSVGFYPTKMLSRHDEGFDKAVEGIKGMNGDQRDQLRSVHVEQQQIELSACVIGANPSALARAFGDKAITEEQLASVGFGTDETFEVLDLAAKVFKKTESGDILREFALNQCRSVLRAHKQFQTNANGNGSATPSNSPMHGEGEQRQSATPTNRAWLKRVADQLDS